MSNNSGAHRSALPSLCIIDMEIVRYLALNRFGKQADLFASINRITPSYNLPRTIRRLKNYGLIEPLLGDANVHLGYRLTKKGLLFADKRLLIPEAALKARPAFRSQYDHDRVVNEARHILCGSQAVSDFVTEAELRAELGRRWNNVPSGSNRDWKVPDAIFKLTTKRGTLRIGLEVELSQKAKARYEKILKTVLISRQFEIVFFLCKNEKLLQLIRREVAEVRAKNATVKLSQRSNGIYFTTLDSLRTLKNDAPWSGEESRFTIREIEASFTKK